MSTSRDRMEKTLATASYFGSIGIVGLVSSAVGPTLESLATRVGVGISTIGVIVTARSLGYLLGALGSGQWVDRRRAHPILAATLGGAAVCLALIPLAESIWSLIGIMACLGITLGGLDVASNALILRTHPEHPGPFINALHSFFGLGGLIAPFVVAAFLDVFGQPVLSYWALALLPIPLLVMIARRPLPPRIREEDSDFRMTARRLSPRFLLSASFYFFYVGGQISLVSWLFTFAEGVAGSQMATYILSGFWAMFTAFRLLGVPIARRWSPHRILIADFTVVLLSAVPLLAWSDSVGALWIGALGMGAAHASIYATGIMLLGERFSLAGTQMGTIVVFACVGSMVFPWMMGRLLPVLGSSVVPGLSTGLMAITFAIVLGVARSNRHAATRQSAA